MLRLTGMLFFMLAVLPLVGCSDSHDKVMGDAVSTMEDISGILDGVTDKGSAEAAEGRLESKIEELNSIYERAAALEEPSEETLAELDQKYEERLADLRGDLLRNMFRILGLGEDVGTPISRAMRGFDEDLADTVQWLDVK